MLKYSRIGIVQRCVQLGIRRFNSTLDSLTSTSSLLSNIFPTCRSCGIRLQTMDKTKPGYYLNEEERESSKKPYVKKEDLVFNEKFNELPVEDRILLMNREFLATPGIHENATRKHIAAYYKNATNILRSHLLEGKSSPSKTEPDALECIRCRDASYRSDFKAMDSNEYPVMSLDSIVGQIPRNEKIIYVVSAQDFPISLNPKIFQHRSSSELFFIINKSDLLYQSNALSLKYGLTFFQDYLNSNHGIPRENVIMVSGTNNWNVKSILDFIGKDGTSYLMGCVNSGKSTIVRSLLFFLELQKKRQEKPISKREKRDFEKLQDININTEIPVSVKKKKELKKFEEQFKAKSGPGVSYMPGFTRSFMRIELPDNKVLYDVPGFVNSNDLPQFYRSIIDPKAMKNISKGSNVPRHGMYDSEYTSFKGGQCFTVLGLFFLNIPNMSMVQIRSCINADFQQLSSFSKAIDIGINGSSYNSLRFKYLIDYDKNNISDLQRYIIPPFYGSIDLVIGNLGHVSITPTGAKKNNEPFIVYLPKGLEARIRQPITQYIAKTFTGRDKNGNPLTKENLVKKSTFALKRYSGKQPFSSQLIPCVGDKELEFALNQGKDISQSQLQADHQAQVVRDYQRISEFASSQTSKPITYNGSTILDENNKYDYWLE